MVDREKVRPRGDGGRAPETTTMTCGCGDYEVRWPEGSQPPSIDVVCPECGNHFGHGGDRGEWASPSRTPPHWPRRFYLERVEDASGVSGTGTVAFGVEYPDGAVHLQWCNAGNDDLETDTNGVAFKPAPDGADATREVHGHDGRTALHWLDPPRAGGDE